MSIPYITADLRGLRENVDRCAQLCHDRGLSLAAVAKCIAPDERITSMLEDSLCDWIADARLDNLRALRTSKPRFLIRVAQPWEVDEVVRLAEISLQSEAGTAALLGKAAERAGVRHRVILSCDLGDLREGCFFENEDDIFRTAEAILASPALELYGVGMNLGCFGGVLPCAENMTGLVRIADALRQRYGIAAPVISGGSSTLIHHLLRDEVVPGINNCRIGELWLTGHDPGLGVDIDGYRHDAIRLTAQLVEVKNKPSKPIGPIGGDAFGVVHERPDMGLMRRGILACGKQDVDLDGMIPVDGRVRVLGGSSDYTILDLTDAPEYAVGDTLDFRLQYGAVLRAFSSRYIERRYIE